MCNRNRSLALAPSELPTQTSHAISDDIEEYPDYDPETMLEDPSSDPPTSDQDDESMDFTTSTPVSSNNRHSVSSHATVIARFDSSTGRPSSKWYVYR
jgi:hypothetical protein